MAESWSCSFSHKLAAHVVRSTQEGEGWGRRVEQEGKCRFVPYKVARLIGANQHLQHLLSFLLLFRVRVALPSFSFLSSVDRSTLLYRGTPSPVYRFLSFSLCSITSSFTTTTYNTQADTMASTMRSTFAKGLVAAVAISSIGVAMAQSAPAPGPSGESAAASLLPTTVATSLLLAVTGFVAARCL